jgi:hypothetical protein
VNPVFRAHIVKACPIFDSDEDGRNFEAQLAKLEGKAVEVVIRPVEAKRSANQNAYYWGVVIKILQEDTQHEDTKTDKKRIHDALRGMFLSRKDWLGKEIVLSTTELSTAEFEEYLSKIRRWAEIALGSRIPLPNEVEIPEFYEEAA